MPEICLKMKYIRLETNDPYYNLAVEEYLFRHTAEDVFMLWQNAPTVVIGKNQNAYAEVDIEYAKANGIRLCRRLTGGGAVYHDLGNVNYTFITSTEKATVLDYAYFTRPIIDALAALGITASLSGRNDLECDGRKFSGNAQYAADGSILHHGTLLFDTDTSVLSRVLKMDKEKLAYRAVKSHQSRVVNLSSLLDEEISAADFIGHLEKHVLKSMGAEVWQMEENDVIRALRERNAGEAWIYSDRRYLTDYTVERRKKYPFGIVSVRMKLGRDLIEDVVISGDFFERGAVENLEKKLLGKNPYTLTDIDVSSYIDGMTREAFCALLAGREDSI